MTQSYPLDPRGSQYGRAFVIAVFMNIIFFMGILLMSSDLFTKPPTTKENIIAIDMSRYEVQGNDATKPKSAPGGGAGTGASSKAAKSTQKIASTPYLGGVEESDVGVKGAIRQGNLSNQPGEGAEGRPGVPDGDPNGGGGSGHGTGDNGGNGYVDLEEYIARLNSMKRWPQQALKRRLSGIAVYSVSFDAEGRVEGASLVSSSGHRILDDAAYNLIMGGGNILNTTGQPTVEMVRIIYEQ